ncbi:hypothetical protein LY78DRAFT_662592 [Colletotrichum sublineola]|nr:hypothetical protein LY78DRAFT_662592 [Colletotrichum sublineola]
MRRLIDPRMKARFGFFVDGGFRRRTDFLEALALSASAVDMGRSFLYSMTGSVWRGWCKATSADSEA